MGDCGRKATSNNANNLRDGINILESAIYAARTSPFAEGVTHIVTWVEGRELLVLALPGSLRVKQFGIQGLVVTGFGQE